MPVSSISFCLATFHRSTCNFVDSRPKFEINENVKNRNYSPIDRVMVYIVSITILPCHQWVLADMYTSYGCH